MGVRTKGCCGVPTCCRRKREANLQEAKANEETSHNLLMSTQGIFGKEGTIDLEPDRLESLFVARDDAANGVSIATNISRQAQEIIAEQSVHRTEGN